MIPFRRLSKALVALTLAATGLAWGCGFRRPIASGSGELEGGLPLVRIPSTNRFEGDFEDRLRAAGPRERRVALVDLEEQLDLRRFVLDLASSSPDRRARRDAVVSALERVAERSQAALAPALDRLIEQGRLDAWRGFAIVNRLRVDGTADGILAIAELPGVARIRPDWSSERVARAEATLTPEGAPVPERFTSWAVEAIGAGALWAEGFDGSGIVVASIDTGAFEGHEQLRGRRLAGDRGWFDPVQGSATPHDNHGHGTSVLSVAIGGNPAGRTVGIAPGASWASALGNWENHYSRSRMTEAADWVLRRVRPDVLVNAWSHEMVPCDDFDLPFVRAWQAAGTLVVFPAGNAGPGEATGESPAQLAGGFPNGGPLFSVAALAPTGRIHPRSSRGPSRCGSPEFPTLAAPGADLPFATPADPEGYAAGHGTSLAAGIVAGAAALLLHASPRADASDVERALRDSSRDLPPAGFDPAAGAGAIDLPAALALLRARSGR